MKVSQLYRGGIGGVFQLIFILYYSNGLLYSSGLIANILIVLSIFVSLYYGVIVNINTKNSFTRYLTIFILLSVVGFIRNPEVYLSYGGVLITRTYSLKIILFALTAYFPFYYISYRYGYDYSKIVPFYIIFFVINMMKFVTKRSELEYEGAESGMNVAYSFVACLPIVTIYMRKMLLSYSLTGLLLIMIILSMKRGAIITGALAIVTYFYYVLRDKYSRKSNRIINVTLLMFFGSILIFLAYKSIMSNDTLLNRFSTISEGSGRDMIYETLINKWLYSGDIINYIFGYGMNVSVKFTGFFAHSDWIELLITSGLLGVIIYVLLIFNLFKNCRSTIDYKGKSMLSMILVTWCVSSVFSMFYFHILSYVYMMLIGIIVGKNDREIKQNFNN